MMLAAFNPVLASVSDAKRDSLCSVISVNSALSLEYLENPAEVIARLDFEDGPDTELASNESSPMKDKGATFDFGDDDAPSRKRRASHLHEPLPFRGEEILAALGDSSSNLFGDDEAADLMDIIDFAQSDTGFALPPVQVDGEIYADAERGRSHSAERRRIQSELLCRLERLDGISLIGEGEQTEIVFENDGTPVESKPTVQPLPSDQPQQPEKAQSPLRPEDPEPKLGIYNEKQRVERINAYREKRKQRVYGKVRYVLRQRVSEARPRVKGRFVKQTDNASAASPDSPDREHDTSAGETPKHSTTDSPPVRRVEFQVDPIPSQESPPPKRGRSAWDMFKRLSIFAAPKPSKAQKEKRPSLPATFSEKLLQMRRKSTTAASTASGKARRRFSRDEFFDEEEHMLDQEPDRKRATSMKKWNH